MTELFPGEDPSVIYQRLALALGVGLIVGLERGWHARDTEAGSNAAGVRTFGLMGLLGGLAGLAGLIVGDLLTLSISVGFFAFVIAAYVVGLRPVGARVPDKGMTTEVAALITYLLGLLAVRGDMTLTAVCAVVLVALLNLKEPLHNALNRLKAFELEAAIKLLLISVVVLPFLPNEGYGPGAIWNPFEFWWMVVLIAALSFFGYFAIRIVGPKKGPLVMGALGGLASSTALTVSASRLVSKAPGSASAFAGAVALSAAMSFGRTLLLALALYPPVVVKLGVPLVLAGLASVIAVLVSQRSTGAAEESDDMLAEMGSPDDFGTALKFGLLLVLVTTLSYYANEWLGQDGLYSVAALSGLVDVDAVTLSMSRLAETPGGPLMPVVAMAILISVVVNTGVKVAIGGYFAGRAFALRLAGIFLPAFILAFVGFLVV
ncbi:MAG: MgtC/SapB family protein [Rhodobiaceae bacterium]|nr:MgtC/SapB family protein [Rhodobiaceae bacterium]